MHFVAFPRALAPLSLRGMAKRTAPKSKKSLEARGKPRAKSAAALHEAARVARRAGASADEVRKLTDAAFFAEQREARAA